jgi:hypothetical protein
MLRGSRMESPTPMHEGPTSPSASAQAQRQPSRHGSILLDVVGKVASGGAARGGRFGAFQVLGGVSGVVWPTSLGWPYIYYGVQVHVIHQNLESPKPKSSKVQKSLSPKRARAGVHSPHMGGQGAREWARRSAVVCSVMLKCGDARVRG